MLRLLGPLVVAVIVLAAPRRVEACSCTPPPAPKQALEQSSAVFEGKITRLAQDKEKHRLTATFAVSRRWKGADTAQVAVTTVDVGSLCGLPFEKGAEWMIYASGDPGGLSTGLCTRTRKKADAGEDRRALGAGKPAVKGSGIADPLASGSTDPTPAKAGDPLASETEPAPAKAGDLRASGSSGKAASGDPLASGSTDPAPVKAGDSVPGATDPGKGAPAPGAATPEPGTAATALAPPNLPAQSNGCGIAEASGAAMIVVPMLIVRRRARRRRAA